MYASEYEYMPYNRYEHATYGIPFSLFLQNVHVQISNRSAQLTSLGEMQAKAFMPFSVVYPFYFLYP